MNNKTIGFISLLICFILNSCDKNDESINPIQSPTIQKSVGDTFQGGIIFYLDGNGGGLIAATSDQSTVSANTDGSNWGCTGNNIIGADSSAVGSGYQNTIDIELGCISAGTAADVCANLNLGGYSDWFLPSKDELDLMWQNLADSNNIGGFAPYTYWSSTEDNSENAWMQNFFTGIQRSRAKSSGYWVRAVRAF